MIRLICLFFIVILTGIDGVSAWIAATKFDKKCPEFAQDSKNYLCSYNDIGFFLAQRQLHNDKYKYVAGFESSELINLIGSSYVSNFVHGNGNLYYCFSKSDAGKDRCIVVKCNKKCEMEVTGGR